VECNALERLLDYIAFTTDFNRRIAEGQHHDFDEFHRFGDLAQAGTWKVPRPDGGVMPMDGNMWFMDGQAIWQHPETPPCSETAAHELWARIADYIAATGRGH
jgi:hypothetical protein